MAILVSLPRLPSLPELCSWPAGGAPESVSSRSAMDGRPPRSCDESVLWTGTVSDSSDESAWMGMSSLSRECNGPTGVGGGGGGGG
jgi:hypothetical protein